MIDVASSVVETGSTPLVLSPFMGNFSVHTREEVLRMETLDGTSHTCWNPAVAAICGAPYCVAVRWDTTAPPVEFFQHMYMVGPIIVKPPTPIAAHPAAADWMVKETVPSVTLGTKLPQTPEPLVSEQKRASGTGFRIPVVSFVVLDTMGSFGPAWPVNARFVRSTLITPFWLCIEKDCKRIVSRSDRRSYTPDKLCWSS
ncbi:hypothetical protein DFJ73DRAFT_368724 [Zopfochytrium polystomum]|nr:hypothetical protein DFJ73DRAFT_368724 [Zopfochytrium polystomum]